jgi:hypothetical protein
MDANRVSAASRSLNIPEFWLRAYSEDHQLALGMNVVVGKAAPIQTPVFTDDIRFIVFRRLERVNYDSQFHTFVESRRPELVSLG